MLRVVCRNGFSQDLADLLLTDLTRIMPELRRQPGPLKELGIPARSGFHH